MSVFFSAGTNELTPILLDIRAGGHLIRTTAEHPFWIIGRGWVPAHGMVVGDTLLGANGEHTVVNSIEGPSEPAVFYNLAIEEYHTYLVGTPLWGFSVWVHNSNYPDAPSKIPNKVSGDAREAAELADLKAANANASIQRERYLRTADGKKAVDPLTGEGRRIDFAVVEEGVATELVETTSLTANKAEQIAKEARIGATGGTFIRDQSTKVLIDVTDVPARISRRG